jgi:hypothetical protein
MQSASDEMDDFLAGLTKAADLLQEQINTIQQLLSSHQSIDDLLPGLIGYEKHLRKGLRIARQSGMEKEKEKEKEKEEPFRKILRRSRRMRERIERISRSRARTGAFLEAFFACEDLRRELLGDLFCREFDEVSLGGQ